MGFDDVFEVAYAAQIITYETKKLMAAKLLEKPAINSACPAVVKLIALRFPNLINNVIPVISPMQLAARTCKERGGAKEQDVQTGDIGAVFHNPLRRKGNVRTEPDWT